MSMNLCCFYFLTRPRNKVEIAPIENHSKIQPEVIIQESPKIEEIPEGITKKLSKQIINKKQIIVAQISKIWKSQSLAISKRHLLLESFFDIKSFRFFVRDVNMVSNVILHNSVSLDFGQNKTSLNVKK